VFVLSTYIKKIDQKTNLEVFLILFAGCCCGDESLLLFDDDFPFSWGVFQTVISVFPPPIGHFSNKNVIQKFNIIFFCIFFPAATSKEFYIFTD